MSRAAQIQQRTAAPAFASLALSAFACSWTPPAVRPAETPPPAAPRPTFTERDLLVDPPRLHGDDVVRFPDELWPISDAVAAVLARPEAGGYKVVPSAQLRALWRDVQAGRLPGVAAICDAQLSSPPRHARVIAAQQTFPTGMLGYWVRRLAEGGLVAALTTTSPPRLAHPDGGPKLAGTNPLAIGIPSSDGKPVVSDVSMAAVTHGDVIAGLARPEDVVPFGGEQAHKAFALAIGLQLLVDSLIGEGHGAVMLVARPEADPVPALRQRAGDVRLPGDRPRG